MGISPTRVSCRPTAGSIIITGMDLRLTGSCPVFWAGQDRSPTLEEREGFSRFTLRKDHGGPLWWLHTPECNPIDVRIQLSLPLQASDISIPITGSFPINQSLGKPLR